LQLGHSLAFAPLVHFLWATVCTYLVRIKLKCGVTDRVLKLGKTVA
jgi:hypothetical protein